MTLPRPFAPIGRAAAAALLALCGAWAAAGPGAAQAEGAGPAPVVVELFTSQGCSSCPPADALLEELAEAPGVVALSLHVDYWDYLGWRDVHARHAFTERQIAYRDMAGARSVYTPQMIINGKTAVVGSRRGEVAEALRSAAARPPKAEVRLMRDGAGELWAQVTPQTDYMGEAVVWLVGYEARPTAVRILRGENAGRSGAHRNVVRSWMRIGGVSAADGMVKIKTPIPEGADGVAVIVQHGRVGPVLGAAKLEF